jgi:hypothetical protein
MFSVHFQLEPKVIRWPCGGSEEIPRQRSHVVKQDSGAFIVIGIQRDTALLLQNATEVLLGIKADAGEVAFHVGSLSNVQ